MAQERDADVDRMLGALEARMTANEQKLIAMDARLDSRLEGMDRRLSAVHDVVVGARGSWKAVVWLLGAIATISGAIGAVWHWLVPK